MTWKDRLALPSAAVACVASLGTGLAYFDILPVLSRALGFRGDGCG